jgi:hypothetical protein
MRNKLSQQCSSLQVPAKDCAEEGKITVISKHPRNTEAKGKDKKEDTHSISEK